MGMLDFLRGSTKTFNLAKGIATATRATPTGLKIPGSDFGRISPENLERAYFKPLIFNTINKSVQIILSSRYTLEGDEKSVKFFNDFFGMVGKRGGTTSWNNIIKRMFLFQFIYGYCPVELIFNSESDYIVDMDTIDPKSFDYAKTSGTAGKIVLDDFGNPLGYVQTVPRSELLREIVQKDIPPNVTLTSNQVFFPKEKIALFKLYEVGDGFHPIGLIEPIYETIQRHEAAESGFTNACFRTGNPIFDATVGDEQNPSTEEQTKNTVTDLTNMLSKDVLAHPHWINIKILEPKNLENLKIFLEYFIDTEINGMGMAKAFATGAGEATNRATLARQEYLMKLTLKDNVNKTTDTIENEIIYKIVELHNEKYPNNQIVPVKVRWNEIVLEELDSFADRLQKYGNGGFITPSEEIEKRILGMENLPFDPTGQKITETPKTKPEDVK